MAALQTARRTLKGARERQKMVKLSRQYYKVQSSGTRAPDARRDDKITCLRCGQQGHRAANCPAPQPQTSAKSSEMAPFVCYTDGVGEGMAMQVDPDPLEAPSTADAVAEGKAILDCGATKSLGSVYALEQVMRLSQNGVSQVDTNNRPVFGFGNSSEDKCVSTLHLNLQAGALDKGTAPVLLSVATLKALGAIVAFGESTMVLRQVDPQRLLTLEQSRAGHLLLPLVGDILDKAVPMQDPIPPLSQFVAASSEGKPSSESE